MISFSESLYRTPQVSGACAVQINETVYFHERCHCESTQLAECKDMCDMDIACKGYTKKTSHCQIATTSSCQSRCSKHDTGNTGSLIVDSDLFYDLSYEGCFIKLGKLTHHMKICKLMNYLFYRLHTTKTSMDYRIYLYFRLVRGNTKQILRLP